MKLDDVQRIAHLSRLELSQAEAELVLPQLQAIFSLVEEMQAVDTSNFTPLAHPILVFARFSAATSPGPGDRARQPRAEYAVCPGPAKWLFFGAEGD